METNIKPPLRALTGVRFLAAFIVVAHHFATPGDTLFKPMIEHGFIGVTLFFLLSGFIISYTYTLSNGKMKGTPASFWKARFARIFPMYVIGLVLAAPILLKWGKTENLHLQALASITLIQAWLPFSMREWNPPGWSLSAEAFFYFLFPFIIRPISQLKLKHLMIFAAVCWAASIIAPLVYLFTGEIDRDFWMFNPLVRLPEFVLGITLGIFWLRHGAVALHMPKYTVEASLLCLVALMSLPIHEAYFMNGACAPLILLILVGLAADRGIIARTLSTPALCILGSASYSLYILHWPLWFEAVSVIHWLKISLNYVFLPVTIGLLLPLSYLFFRFIEEPLNRYLRKLFANTPTPVRSHSQARQVLEDPLVHRNIRELL